MATSSIEASAPLPPIEIRYKNLHEDAFLILNTIWTYGKAMTSETIAKKLPPKKTLRIELIDQHLNDLVQQEFLCINKVAHLIMYTPSKQLEEALSRPRKPEPEDSQVSLEEEEKRNLQVKNKRRIQQICEERRSLGLKILLEQAQHPNGPLPKEVRYVVFKQLQSMNEDEQHDFLQKFGYIDKRNDEKGRSDEERRSDDEKRKRQQQAAIASLNNEFADIAAAEEMQLSKGDSRQLQNLCQKYKLGEKEKNALLNWNLKSHPLYETIQWVKEQKKLAKLKF